MGILTGKKDAEFECGVFDLWYPQYQKALRAQRAQLRPNIGGYAKGKLPPISLVAHAIAKTLDTNDVTAGPINTTWAKLLVVAVAKYGDDTGVTLADSKSNTWLPLTLYGGASVSNLTLYYAANPVVDTNHSFTLTSTARFPAIAVLAFSDVKAASPFDVENGAAGAIVSSLQTGSVAPSLPNEVLVTATIQDVAVASIDSGFTISDQLAGVPGVSIGVAMAYKVQTAAAAVNPTWSYTIAVGEAVAAIATFKHG